MIPLSKRKTNIRYFLSIIFLFLVTYALHSIAHFSNWKVISSNYANWSDAIAFFTPNTESILILTSWISLQSILYYLLPGKMAKGAPAKDGLPLEYRINGMSAMIVSFTLLSILHFLGIWKLAQVYENLGALISTTTILALLFGVSMFVYGRRSDPNKISGIVFKDFWLGTGLNPRLPQTRTGFDFKFFCESRPGLIGWMVINFSMAAQQYEAYGKVSVAMIIVIIMQLLYIWYFFSREEYVLDTMDIKSENFGLMLVYGDLVWVPFMYSLQAYYLVDHVHDLPLWAAGAILGLNAFGFYLFHATNMQKFRFRQNPEKSIIWGKKAKYLETKRGTKILISGFWGKARHMNYTGDLIQSIAWSLPCLFDSLLPYFYPVFFTGLLIHRDLRDDAICLSKYGSDWIAYRKLVKWRIIPGIY